MMRLVFANVLHARLPRLMAGRLSCRCVLTSSIGLGPYTDMGGSCPSQQHLLSGKWVDRLLTRF